MSSILAKNTLQYTLALIGQKIIAFGYNIFIANQLGVVGNGQYFFAVSFATMYSVIADLGISATFIREGTQRPTERDQLFNDALALKMPLAIFMIVLVNGIALAGGYAREIRLMIFIATLSTLLESIHLLLFAALRTVQKLRYEAVILFLGQVVILATGVGLLQTTRTPLVLVVALLVGNLWNLSAAAWVARRELGLKATLRFDLIRLLTFGKIALPFAAAGIFTKVYSYIDSIFLKHYSGFEALGVYGVAYKFTYAFQFLPLAFIAGLFPAFAELYSQDRARLPALFERSIWYMAVLSFPLVAGVLAIGERIVATLFRPEFGAASEVLMILFPVLLFIFLDFPVMALLNASHRQNIKTALMGVTVVINIVLNAFLVPSYGAKGAAIAALASFSWMFLAGFVFIWHIFAIRLRILILLAKVALAAAAMYGTVMMTKPHLPWPALIILGGAVYVIALFAFKGISRHDLSAFRTLISKSEATTVSD